MKKAIAVLLSVSMILGLAACGGDSGQTTSPSTSAKTESAAPAESKDTTEASGGLEGTYSFNIGSSSTAGSTTSNVFEAVQADISEASGGKMQMTYYGSSSLGTDSEMLTECQNGNLPMVIVTTASLTSFIPEMGIFDMPCTATSMEQFAALFENAEFMEKLQTWFAAAGLRLVAWDTSASKLLASTEPVEKVADFQNLDMRTLNNKYQIAFWKGLGTNTIQIDASEIYLSMQQGLIDGVEFSMSGIQSRKINEVCKYVIETMDMSQINMVVMSESVYESMSDGDKAWFDQYMAGVSKDFTAASAQDVEAGWTALEAANITCLRFNQTLFDEMKTVASETAWPLIREEVGDEVVDFYLKALEAVSK
ncbi:TRAP transporter substrate-binding protein [Hominifimenecus sp. rT4P-3]|uniref:TRAP transporter substrate-binding protein n=1 Tax=Hominifimenecus sp. rT4P-3 TaxID=3242979 RepID=UPI003DA2EC0C